LRRLKIDDVNGISALTDNLTQKLAFEAEPLFRTVGRDSHHGAGSNSQYDAG
jgi:hypothetical protein